MSALMKPLSRDLGWFRNDLSNFWELVNNPRNLAKSPLSTMEWSPAVDITENDKKIEIKADLPAVSKKDIEVTIDGGILTISGERQSTHEETKGDVRHVERSFGSYSRSFTLPDNIDEKHITADYKDGVLTLSIPKTAKTSMEQKKIKIS